MKQLKSFISYFIICICLIGTFSSCINPHPDALTLLEQAQKLMNNHPDSAMSLIDSIFYPEESLPMPQYMQYIVTRVQARYKNYLPVSEDTLIFAAKSYFAINNKDLHKTTLSFFYSGAVYREQGNLEQAMKHYKEAEHYAALINDVDIKGLVQFNIGDVLAEQGLYDKALYHYKLAEGYYAQSTVKPYHQQVQSLSAIGRMLFLSGKQDSSFIFFHKGLQLAKNTKDYDLQSLLAQNLSIAYAEESQFTKAEKYLHESFIWNADTIELPRYYLNFAELYTTIGQSDSAKFYTQKLKNSISLLESGQLKASVYGYLAENERMNGNYDAAFDYQTNYIHEIEKITENRLQQSSYEAQKKYDYEVVKNKYAQQITIHQQWLILLLAVLLAGGIIFTVYTIRQKNILLRTRDNIDTLRQMAIDLVKSHEANMQRKENDLRNYFYGNSVF